MAIRWPWFAPRIGERDRNGAACRQRSAAATRDRIVRFDKVEIPVVPHRRLFARDNKTPVIKRASFVSRPWHLSARRICAGRCWKSVYPFPNCARPRCCHSNLVCIRLPIARDTLRMPAYSRDATTRRRIRARKRALPRRVASRCASKIYRPIYIAFVQSPSRHEDTPTIR